MAANIRGIMRAKAPYGQGITKMKAKLTPEQSSTPSLMPETNTVYLTRVTEGTGELMKLVGGSVARNQIVPTTTSVSGSVAGVTTSVSNGEVTISGTASATGNITVGQISYTAPANHVILITAVGQGDVRLGRSGFGAGPNNNYVFSKHTSDFYVGVYFYIVSGVQYNCKKKVMVHNLTLALGSTLADYVYSLEQSQAGSGIQWLKDYDLIDDQYHAHSAPTLQSVEATAHVTVGKNLAPYPSTENGWENGYISGSGTIASQSATQLEMTSDYIPIWDATSVTLSYTLSSMPSNTNWCGFGFYADKSVGSFVSRDANTIGAATSVSLSKAVPSGAKYFRVTLRTYGIVDTLQAEYGSTATTYEPYVKHTQPLDSDLVLRGIPKLDNGNLYYDGDTYEWDGTVTRKYGIVDMGTLTWSIRNNTAVRQAWNADVPGRKLSGSTADIPNLKTTDFVAVANNDTWTPGIITDSTSGSSYICICVDPNKYSTGADVAAALSGQYLLYELATSTTESADPFTAVQTVEDGGTEEFVTTNGVPVGVVGRFANAVPMEGVDSFTVTADDGTTHTYPVTLSEEIYRGYVDMLTGEAVSDMASIAEYNGETINSPWLSSLDVYALGATPTKGAQVVYPITPEEVTAAITGDPSELSGVVSATSTEGTVEWSELSEIGIKCIMKRKNPFQ